MAAARRENMARSLAWLLALVACAAAGDQGDVIGDDPDTELATSIEWDEIECDDRCEKRANAEWQYVTSGASDDLERKIKLWKEELAFLNETSSKYRQNKTITNPDLIRKVQLVSYVGEALLPEENRNLIVDFTKDGEQLLRTGHVNCKENVSLDLSGVEAGLAEYRDADELQCLWHRWHELFLPLQDRYLDVLKLADAIAAENENPDVESYWLMLAEYPGVYSDAKKLWQEIEPFYLKLHKYVHSHLARHYGPDVLDNNSTIPPHLLGSLGALDWTNIADIVLGKDAKAYVTLQKNLNEQEVSGKKAYELADKLVQSMGFEGLHKDFWEDSRFNSTCHSAVVEYCSTGRTRVSTCNKTSWSQFMEAHEITMKSIRRQVISEQPYFFMNPNRQSAADEAAVQLLPLLAATPANLQRIGLLPADMATSPDTAVMLKLLVALRTLPRLPYYLAADLWRLELLTLENITVDDGALSWKQYKQKFQHTETIENSTWLWDFLLDEHISTNKPYLAKFAGAILQFQMLELFENRTSNESTVVKVIQEGDHLKQLLKDGLSAEWPVLLNKHLGIGHVDSAPLLRYFRSLEKFLDGEENVTHNRGMTADTGGKEVSSLGEENTNGNATNLSSDISDKQASSIGSGILIGCATVAIIGIVATVVLVARRKLKRGKSDYHLAKTNPE